MSIIMNLYYKGKDGNALKFIQEMKESGIVDKIKAEEGNEKYDYFISTDDPEEILLIDAWRDQEALDAHHATPMMQEIMNLREKYDLNMRAERYTSDENGISDEDKKFIRN